MQEKSTQSRKQGSTKTILVIDDDFFIRKLYEEVLKNEGYNVDLAEDGEIGLSKLEKHYYDITLLGIIMPKLDGIGVLKKIKEMGIPHGKIVIVTNFSTDGVINEVFELEADGFEIKASTTPNDLVHRVNGYLSGATTREESRERALRELKKLQAEFDEQKK
jgi:CheY-like chemotaxis protein